MIKQCYKFIFLMIVCSKMQASPTAVSYGGIGLSTTTAYAVICGGTTSTGALQSIASVGTSGQALVSAGAAALPAFGTLPVAGGGTGVTTMATGSIVIGAGTSAVTPLAIGTSTYELTSNGTTPGWTQGPVVQTVFTSSNTYVNTTAVMPDDDTIPQNTEGAEMMTLAITPKNAANLLEIYFSTHGTTSNAGPSIIALFQDTTANALAASYIHGGVSDTTTSTASYGALRYRMTAGTTSATTFKIRAGLPSATGSWGQNGSTTARRYGTASITSLSITEYTV